MTKIFVTGVTGLVGGDVVAALLAAHPDYEIACLVRDHEKGALVAQAHPSVRLVYGDLDDAMLMEEEARKVDIVCHLGRATHDVSAKAFAQGLLRREETSSPGYLIHNTGSGIVLYDDVAAGRYGEASDRVYNDWDGLSDVLAVPDFARAREAERAVRQAGEDHPNRLKTAIVCMGTIYGEGRGIKRYRQAAIHDLARVSLQQGHAVQVSEGLAAWPHVHIADVTDLYVRLVENAAAGGTSPSVWGPEGFYFAEHGEHVWGEFARQVAAEAVAQGLLSSNHVQSISPSKAGDLIDKGQFFWGCNARVKGQRAQRVLGWQPQGPSLRSELRTIVTSEAVRLGPGAICSANGVSKQSGGIACTHKIAPV